MFQQVFIICWFNRFQVFESLTGFGIFGLCWFLRFSDFDSFLEVLDLWIDSLKVVFQFEVYVFFLLET